MIYTTWRYDSSFSPRVSEKNEKIELVLYDNNCEIPRHSAYLPRYFENGEQVLQDNIYYTFWWEARGHGYVIETHEPLEWSYQAIFILEENFPETIGMSQSEMKEFIKKSNVILDAKGGTKCILPCNS